MTINDIIAIGRQIAAETAEGGNTAARVGGVIEAIGEILKNQDYMSWQPAGDFDIETLYEKDNQVFDAETNSCYVSLQTDNVGHPVNENDESYEEGWWMKVIDGASVLSAAAAATQAAAEANQAAEAARGIVYQAVDDHLDAESLKPVANQVVTQAINNLSTNLQDVEGEMIFDEETEISFSLRDNIVYGYTDHVTTTTNNSWKAALAINVRELEYVRINFYVLSSQAPHAFFTDANGTMIGEKLWNVSGEYKEFVVPENAAYLYVSTNKSMQAAFGIKKVVKTTIKERINKMALDDMSLADPVSPDSDMEISDSNDNVIMQLMGGHIKTKNFDSRDIIPLRLKGKHLAIIGDSVSTYAGYIPAGWKTHYTAANLASVNLTYWKKLCDTLQMTFNNCSYSTSRASGDSTATAVSGSDGECAGCSDVRINALSRDGMTPDIVLIFLGINDWANNVPIGTFCEDGALPAEGVINDFSAAYALMINKIRTLYPTVRIFCCTIFSNLARETVPPFRGGSSPYTNGNALYTYNKIIRDVARIMGCDVIDLAACGINNISAPYTTHDNKVHPNAAGFTLMYNKIVSELIAKY